MQNSSLKTSAYKWWSRSRWISVTKISKYGQNKYSQALNASYTFQPLMGFCMNQINILWSFSSIEASISEIFAIKNCYCLALIFVERSEKLSEKTACDVNVGQVKKAGNSKQSFSSRLGAEVVCAATNLERTGNLSSKVASCGYNLLII